MEKAERYLTFSLISFVLFLLLAVFSNFKGLSLLLYGSFVCLALTFLFFVFSMRFMGERDLFDVLGSLTSKAMGRISRKDRASEEPTMKSAIVESKPSELKPAEQGSSSSEENYQGPSMSPPPTNQSVPQDSQTEPICPRCGKRLPPLAIFCSSCGLQVHELDASTDDQKETM